MNISDRCVHSIELPAVRTLPGFHMDLPEVVNQTAFLLNQVLNLKHTHTHMPNKQKNCTADTNAHRNLIYVRFYFIHKTSPCIPS